MNTPTPALANAALDWCEERGPRDRGDAELNGEPTRTETPTGLLSSAQHSDDLAVDQFAVAMKAKLAASRAKGRAGWRNPGDPTDAQLAQLMTQCMTKGNAGTFEDVANYCMFLHQRGADPITLASAAFYTPTTNFQRNTLLAALKEVREALQHAVKPPRAAITDTVWMLNRPETLFDFIDATLEGLDVSEAYGEDRYEAKFPPPRKED
jgi:hypothetical protein